MVIDAGTRENARLDSFDSKTPTKNTLYVSPVGLGTRSRICQEDSTMNRRKAIGSMTAAAVAAPLALGADDEISDWVGWWERSKKYTLQIAEAMPERGYDFRPFQRAS